MAGLRLALIWFLLFILAFNLLAGSYVFVRLLASARKYTAECIERDGSLSESDSQKVAATRQLAYSRLRMFLAFAVAMAGCMYLVFIRSE